MKPPQVTAADRHPGGSRGPVPAEEPAMNHKQDANPEGNILTYRVDDQA